MPIPPDHQMVGPAGGAPFDEIECPDDGAEVAAADIRRVAAACLGNHQWLSNLAVKYAHTVRSFAQPNATYSWPGSLTFVTTSIETFPFADAAAVGDVIKASLVIDVSGTTGSNGLRLVAIEDVGGANTVSVMPGSLVYAPAAYGQVVLQGAYTCVLAGGCKVALQVEVPSSGNSITIDGWGSLIAEKYGNL